jgi:hypothetical protein
MQPTRIEVDEFGDSGIECHIPWLFGMQPAMVAPGVELIRGQNAPDRGSGDVLDDVRRNKLACQSMGVPLR